MSWWEANIARRRNITDAIGNISRTAGSMAELEESRAGRRQQAMQHLTDILQTLAGRKHEMKRLEKEYGLRGTEQEAERGWRSGEAEKERAYGTSEREAGEQHRIKHELPWQEKIAAAGKSAQYINTEMAKHFELLQSIYDGWVQNVIAQNPEWQVKDEYGAVVGYKIPPDVHEQFIQYANRLNLPEDVVRAFVESMGGGATPAPATPTPAQAPAPTPSSKTTGRPQTPAMEALSPEQQNLLAQLQSARRQGKNLQDQLEADNLIFDIQRNPQNYQQGGAGWAKIITMIDKLIKTFAPGPEKMPKYRAFGLD